MTPQRAVRMKGKSLVKGMNGSSAQGIRALGANLGMFHELGDISTWWWRYQIPISDLGDNVLYIHQGGTWESHHCENGILD